MVFSTRFRRGEAGISRQPWFGRVSTAKELKERGLPVTQIPLLARSITAVAQACVASVLQGV